MMFVLVILILQVVDIQLRAWHNLENQKAIMRALLFHFVPIL